MRIAPLADVKARSMLAYSPRFQALLDESRAIIGTGKPGAETDRANRPSLPSEGRSVSLVSFPSVP